VRSEQTKKLGLMVVKNKGKGTPTSISGGYLEYVKVKGTLQRKQWP
jgi:hypothetical protein